jgi:hypothetical protein
VGCTTLTRSRRSGRLRSKGKAARVEADTAIGAERAAALTCLDYCLGQARTASVGVARAGLTDPVTAVSEAQPIESATNIMWAFEFSDVSKIGPCFSMRPLDAPLFGPLVLTCFSFYFYLL